MLFQSGCEDCPDRGPQPEYDFTAINVLRGNAVEVVNGKILTTDKGMEITYSTPDGSSWRIVYRRR
jgi:hypothetical protein